MLQTQKYYKHSGTIGVSGAVITLFFGLVVTAVTGAVYSYAIHYIPLIYLNFLLTMGFGFAIGYVVGFGGKIGKVRNTGFLTLCGLVFGILGVYVSWVVWIFILTEHEYLVFAPQDIQLIMQAIASEGAWEIFGWVPKGWALYSVWILESIIIIGLATLMARNFLVATPYCERCEKWIENEDLIGPLSTVHNPDGMKLQLETGDFSALYALPTFTQNDFRFSLLQLLHCPSCSQNHYLTLNDVTVEASEDKDKTTVNAIVENLVITPELHETLKQNWQDSSESPVPDGIEDFQQPSS